MAKKDSDAVHVFTQKVSQLHLAYRQFIQARFRQSDIDLTVEMLQVLNCLWQQDGINQQEIADTTVKDKASITCLIDNLVRRNLVYRQEDSADRRNKLVLLTDAGRQLQQRIHPIIEELHKLAGQGLSGGALAEVSQLLDIVIGNLKNSEPGT